MEMKDFLSIVSGDKKQLNEGVEECGGAMPPAPMPEPDPVTMSVNLNARGVDSIRDLLNLMSKADSMQPGPDYDGDGKLDPHEKDHAKEIPIIKSLDKDGDMDHDMDDHGAKMPIAISMKAPGSDEGPMNPLGMDGNKSMAMVRDLIAKADSPKAIANAPEEAYAGVDAVTTDAGDGPNAPKHPKDIRIKDPSPFEEYENEPDEEYADHELMIKDLSGGLNRQKRSFKAAQQGDNAMAVQEMLRKELLADYRLFKESKK